MRPVEGGGVEAQAAAASGRRPSGRDLPTLIAGEPDCKEDHIRATCSISPVASLVNTAIPGRVRALARSKINNATATIERRPSALRTLPDVNAGVSKYRTHWAEILPMMFSGSTRKFTAASRAAEALRLSGFRHSSGLGAGVPIPGGIPAAASILAREKPAAESHDSWACGISQRNRSTA